MNQIKYYRTWGITIYDGTKVYGIEYTDDNGKTWYNLSSGYASMDIAELEMKLMIMRHNSLINSEKEIATGKYSSQITPRPAWDEEWKLWSER